ncbi:M48 family metallopeptidase [Formicincola oecophyllae]|uniref:M48 family metallopeptidase n=1 Tax=Formicincola oecophyllae TaxID=2558361 RepID=A0A4Y6U8H9_9PROT|nr:SprT family zinc-dependent metalloprotease [Formicincola oecophyllae]QDH13672.1 M48 family metallopeptidase [Formicincola oecophyllae]
MAAWPEAVHPHQASWEGLANFPIVWRHSSRARHISLRLDPQLRGVVVTLPTGASRQMGHAFLASRMDWVTGALAKLPAPALESGAVMVGGQRFALSDATEAALATTTLDRANQTLFLKGASAHKPRRLRDFLRAEAGRTFPALLAACAQGGHKNHGLPLLRPSSLALRDPTSRWGSCTRQGRLMLSWRLIMAPPDVRDYVMAHELAHLHHFNHSAAFWHCCGQLHEAPWSSPEGARSSTRAHTLKEAEAWLRQNGLALHAMV